MMYKDKYLFWLPDNGLPPKGTMNLSFKHCLNMFIPLSLFLLTHPAKAALLLISIFHIQNLKKRGTLHFKGLSTHMRAHTPDTKTHTHNNTHIHSASAVACQIHTHTYKHTLTGICRYINTFSPIKWGLAHTHTHNCVHCRPGTDQGEVQADTHTSLMIYVMRMRGAALQNTPIASCLTKTWILPRVSCIFM